MAEAIRRIPILQRRWPVMAVSPTVAYVIRFGVATTAAIWIGKAPGLIENSPTWILITVLMVLQPAAGGALIKGLLRAIGTLAGAFTAIALFGLFAQDPPLLVAGLTSVQVVATYGYTGPRFQYAWFVWAFTTAIVLGPAVAGQEAVETLAFQRASMVGIGILLVFLVDSLFWPVRAELRARQSLAARARQLGGVLRNVVAGSVETPAGDSAEPSRRPSELASQLALVNSARTEIGVTRERADALLQLTLLLETLASRARLLAQPIEAAEFSGPGERDLLAARNELGRLVEEALQETSSALSTARAPRPFSEDIRRALLDLDGARERAVQRRGWSRAAEGRASDLRDLVSVLCTVEALLSSQPTQTSVEAETHPRRQWRPDPFRTKVALRTGIATVAALLVPMALGWPMNTLVVPVAFMLTSLTRGAVVQTLTALAAVVALGWLFADLVLVYLTPTVDRAPFAMALAFVIGAALAYVGTSRPRLAMLPSFGGLIAFLSVFGGPGAPTNVYGSYNTVCYIALAMGIGWLFSQSMWPATAAGLFRQRMATQLELCRETIRDAGTDGERNRRRRAGELIRAYVQQSMQIVPLHAQAVHEPVERGLDEARRVAILALAMELVDATLGDRPGAIAAVADGNGEALRPLREALHDEGEVLLANLQRTIDALRGVPTGEALDLDGAQRRVEDQLAALRQNPAAHPAMNDEERRRVLVEVDTRRRLASRLLAIDRWHAEWASA